MLDAGPKTSAIKADWWSDLNFSDISDGCARGTMKNSIKIFATSSGPRRVEKASLDNIRSQPIGRQIPAMCRNYSLERNALAATVNLPHASRVEGKRKPAIGKRRHSDKNQVRRRIYRVDPESVRECALMRADEKEREPNRAAAAVATATATPE